MPYRLKVAYTTAQHRQWSHKSGFPGVCEFNPLSMAFVLLERGGLGPMACLLRQRCTAVVFWKAHPRRRAICVLVLNQSGYQWFWLNRVVC